MKIKHNKGWICLHRQILEWGWWGDTNTVKIYIYLMLKANHVANDWYGITVGRGELITSYTTLAKDNNLSKKAVEIAIKKLLNSGSIIIKKSKKGSFGFTHLSLCNYSLYQGVENTLRGNERTFDAPLTDNERTYYNNDNNENKVAAGGNFVYQFLNSIDFTDWNTREGNVRIGKAIQNEFRPKGFKIELLDKKFDEMRNSKEPIRNANNFWRKILTEIISNSISEI